MKKQLSAILLLTFFMFLPFAYATTYVCDSISIEGVPSVQTLTGAYPDGGATMQAMAQTFTAGTSGYLTRIVLGIKQLADDSCTLLVNLEGTGNALNAAPNGTIFAEADPVSTSGISNTTYELVEFEFNGTYYVNQGTVYAWVIYATNPSAEWGTASNGTTIEAYTASAAGGYRCFWQSAAWSAPGTADNAYQVYVSDTLGGDPTPTPAPLPTGGSYDTSDTDAVISTLSGYLVPLLTFLLPALILGWVTHWEKWPIMIGLAIGAGLTYLFLGSVYVWLVFLVAVGLAGMVFSGRMRHDE